MSLSTAPVRPRPSELESAPARFTIDGDDALEQHLHHCCRRVLESVLLAIPRSRIEAVMLGGGYGRGEGGVLRMPGGDQPYNDLEFYVFLRGHPWRNQRSHGHDLQKAAHQLTPEAGVEVELKIDSLSRLRRRAVSMFYYDLLWGHRLLWGNPAVLHGTGHQRCAHAIPLVEATRLLMNRFTGLLLARERLHAPALDDEAADFIQRNVAKAQLALGDAVLVFHGQYHWSCRERRQRLRDLPITSATPWLEEVKGAHQHGVEFKLHPPRETLPREQLRGEMERVVELAHHVWLWLESSRLKREFSSMQEYALSDLNKCPELPVWRCRLIAAKSYGPAALVSDRGASHPRQWLFHALALLLWEPKLIEEATLLLRVQRELRSSAKTVPELVRDYRQIWQQFN